MTDLLSRTRKVKGMRLHVYGSPAPAIVDPEDFLAASECSWHLNSEGFVVTNHKASAQYLASFVMGEADSAVTRICFLNGDRLDCRRVNLYAGTPSECGATARLSKANTSGFKGVSFSKSTGKWAATIWAHGKKSNLGVFADKEDAARSYDAAALKFYGPIAMTNKRMGLLTDEAT